MIPQMSNMPLPARDRTIIDFVLRHRMATNRTIGASVLPGRSRNAVTKVTARLCANEILTRYTFIPPETYFRLGPRAINVLGLSPRLTEPLGPQSLPINYATLIYISTTKTPRRRLTRLELSEYLPWLCPKLATSPYCLDPAGRLDLIRVDLGASPQHIARKVTSDVIERLDVPQLAELAVQSRFRVAVLTTSDEKSRLIGTAVRGAGCPDVVPIHLVVIPGLSVLLLRSS